MLNTDEIRERFSEYRRKLSDQELLTAKFMMEGHEPSVACAQIGISVDEYQTLAASARVDAVRWLLTALHATATAENYEKACENWKSAAFDQARTINRLSGNATDCRLH